jgi:UDP-2,3-diacylglucosamine pyrophosphatase LpxH
LFLSDIHLSTGTCQSASLVRFLEAHDADVIYLVGDIVDFWRVRRHPRWPESQSEALRLVLEKASRGARVVYIPGNHDEEMRTFAGLTLGPIEIRLRDVHVTGEGKRYLVTHGDEFDLVVRKARWLALLGDMAYEAAMAANGWLNAVRRVMGLNYWSLSAYLKYRVKRAVSYIGNFETMLASEARKANAEGVICGHIHYAAMREVNGVAYVNTGDWVESCTAVVEDQDGKLEMIRWGEMERSQANAKRRKPVSVSAA